MNQRKTQTKKSLSSTLLQILLNHFRWDNCVRLSSVMRLRILLKKNGYEVIRINHLGDWGTLYGKLAVAYTLGEDQDRKSVVEGEVRARGGNTGVAGDRSA